MPATASAPSHFQDYWINPRLKIAALWTSMLFVFVYVDLFSLYRADVRADLEAGKVFAFTVGEGFLLGVTVYVAVPSVMLFLSLVLSVRVLRVVNLVLAGVYAVTIVGGAVGEWNYYIFGSVMEAALLAGVVYLAWTWPRATEDSPAAGPASVETRASSARA